MWKKEKQTARRILVSVRRAVSNGRLSELAFLLPVPVPLWSCACVFCCSIRLPQGWEWEGGWTAEGERGCYGGNGIGEEGESRTVVLFIGKGNRKRHALATLVYVVSVGS